MKYLNKSLILFFVWTSLMMAQNIDSIKNVNKLKFSPNFWGAQVEATTFLAVGEIGGLIDYDVFSSENKRYHAGIRLSVEKYDYASLDVGGKQAPGPFLDVNLYARHSIRGKHFWFSPLLGFSLHNSLEENPHKAQLLFRGGLELKYNLISDKLGIVFKIAGSFRENTVYAGIGLSFGIYDS